MVDKIEYLKEAIRLAADNLEIENGGPFGAVVVKNGKIIGKGVNTVTSKNDPTAHAEVNAIREACNHLGSFQLDDCEIYASCEPCPMCLGAIYWARPKELYFASTRLDAARAGFDDSKIYDELKLDHDKRELFSKHIPLEEANEVFNSWITQENKIVY